MRLGRGTGGLLYGHELSEAEQWLASPDAVDLGYTDDLAALVRASWTYQEKMRKQQRRITLSLWGAVQGGFLLL